MDSMEADKESVNIYRADMVGNDCINSVRFYLLVLP